jgi:diguanylate cyclase (GGDEF)-like protein
MRNRSFYVARSVGIVAGYLLLFALCLFLTRPYKMAVSYPFQLVAVWFAALACFWRAVRCSSRVRVLWSLLSAAVFLWAVGLSLSAWEDLTRNSMQIDAGASDLFYLLYGVPILLAISLPTDRPEIGLFPWIDGVQVVMTTCLVYVTLFSTFPFMHQVPKPISASLLQATYNIENFAFAGFATLRLLGRPNAPEARRFYQILAAFLWAYTLCAGLYNHVTITLQEQTGMYDLLVIFPFLLVAGCALLPQTQQPAEAKAPMGSLLTSFIDNASPILYTYTLLAFGIAVTRTHFGWAVSAIVIALFVYGARSILLQNRLIRSQYELRQARDQLEVISLRDSLTGVANRRCFDQILAAEWARAMRLQSSLSLLMIDIDYFKNLNDQYGHRYGDECLIKVAAALQSALTRSGDLLARYGGEEFAAILMDTDRQGAEVVAARMQSEVGALMLNNKTSLGDIITISVGIATCITFEGGSAAALVQASDRALYQAKEHGRNRIQFGSTEFGSNGDVAAAASIE